tara:strand:+ start:370 stop:1107 length:738 start_codon:yes stop_codon:yes gene_type:complete
MPHIKPSGLRVPSQIKFLPTANVLDYGEDLALHLTSVGFTEQSITYSAAAITRSLDEGGQPLDAIPHVYSDTDTGLILHEGADTQFSTDYVFNSDMVATVLKTSINVCMGLNVSAYTSGNFNLGNLIVTITEQGGSKRNLYTNTFASGAANLAATGTSLHWFTVDIVEPFQVFPNQPITINLTLESTLATGTSQAGIVTVAPYVNTAVMKSFAESAVMFHIHAGLGHADDIFRFNMDRVKSEAFD